MKASEAVKDYATPLSALAILCVMVAQWLFTPIEPPPPGPGPIPVPKPIDPVVDPPPPATGALEAAARDYARGLAASFDDLAAQVKSGAIATKADAVEFRKGSARPLSAALDAAFAAHSDEEGKITDPAGLARDLAAAAQAAGAK